MPKSPNSTPSPQRLVILLNNVVVDEPESMHMPFRYAMTAAAMDLVVEMHAVSRSIAMLRRGAASPALMALIRQAVELGVEIFACPLALTEQGLRVDDLIDEVTGVRGAASLLAAGFESGARFLAF